MLIVSRMLPLKVLLKSTNIPVVLAMFISLSSLPELYESVITESDSPSTSANAGSSSLDPLLLVNIY